MSILKAKYDCFHDMPEVEPNGDISGPGVIAGFLGTAYLSIFVLACYYLFVFDPKKNPYHQQPEPTRDLPMRLIIRDSPRIYDRRQPKAYRELTGKESNGEDNSGKEVNVGDTNGGETIVSNTSGDDTNGEANGDEQTELDGLLGYQGEDSQQQPESQPEVDPPPASTEHEADWSPNPIDIWFLENVRRFPNVLHKALPKLFGPRQPRRRDVQAEAEIEGAFSDCMRSICNNQLMTGLGILISAYCILHRADGQGLITAYHWQIAVYLGWLSNLTHMTGLTLLRSHLAHHNVERLWRVLSMTCLFLLVLVSLQPLIYFNWEAEGQEYEAQAANASSHAVCFFNPGVARERMKNNGIETAIPYSSGSSAIVSMLLLAFSFTTRMIKLSATSSRFSRLSIRKRASDKMKRFVAWLSPKSTHAKDKGQPILTENGNMIATFGMAALLTGRFYIDLLTSMLAEVYWALVSVAWASMRIFKTRSSAHVKEDMFSFGQMLAAVLLVAPFVTTLAAMWSLRHVSWVTREPRDPPRVDRPGPLIETFCVYRRSRESSVWLQVVVDWRKPTARPSAAGAYRHFADSTTSHTMPETSRTIKVACSLILYETAIFFRDIGWRDAKVVITIANMAIVAFGGPLFCFSVYFSAVGAAVSRVRPESDFYKIFTAGVSTIATGFYNLAAGVATEIARRLVAGMRFLVARIRCQPALPPAENTNENSQKPATAKPTEKEKENETTMTMKILELAFCVVFASGMVFTSVWLVPFLLDKIIHASTGIMPPNGYFTLVAAVVYSSVTGRWWSGGDRRSKTAKVVKVVAEVHQTTPDGTTGETELHHTTPEGAPDEAESCGLPVDGGFSADGFNGQEQSYAMPRLPEAAHIRIGRSNRLEELEEIVII